jgi:hypothetical protein
LPWTPLSSRLSNRPLILAGPILRRTERNLVTVWLALRRRVTNLRLDILDSTDSSVVMSGTLNETTAIGDNLHLAVITAQSGANLQNDRLYLYDIAFGSEGGQTLDGAGILSSAGSASGGIGKIVYGSFTHPSFLLPPSNLSQLRLMHGSCRKPHGGELDAMIGIHQVLQETHGDNNRRPHQLYLTGDQIYADDVAGILLFLLQDAGNALLGWLENVPMTNPGDLLPGSVDRTRLINETAGLTSGEGKCHLIRLSEFYCMYLFAWSNELWPTSSDIDDRTQFFSLDATQSTNIKIFLTTLPDVRRALANIPSYMIFDDHEITDDWFLNREWCETILGGGQSAQSGNALGKRIIQNGLTAFGLFQSWGNNPAYYATAPGLNLINGAATLHQNRGANNADWDTLAALVLPQLASMTGGYKLEHNLTWHYQINFETHQLVALDSRTRRFFRGRTSGAGLINPDSLPGQLPPRPGGIPMTIVLSGAPVIGHTLLEETLQPLLRRYQGPSEPDYEAWVFDRTTFEGFFQRLVQYGQVVILSGDVHYGFSAAMSYWDARAGTGAAVRRARFVQLCASSFKNQDTKTRLVGDNYVPLSWAVLWSHSWLGWNQPGEYISRINAWRLVLAAVTAFAGVLSAITLATLLTGLPRERLRVEGQPAMHRLKAGDQIVSSASAPQWRYRIDFVADQRTNATRGIPSPTITSMFESGVASALAHGALVSQANRTVIGRDNLGIVTFNWDPAGQQEVRQMVYYNLPDVNATDFRPFTQHVLACNIPPVGDPMPGS